MDCHRGASGACDLLVQTLATESAQVHGLGGGNWTMLGRHLGVLPDLPERIHALEYHSLFRIAPSLFLPAHQFVEIRRDVVWRTLRHRQVIHAQVDVPQENCNLRRFSASSLTGNGQTQPRGR